MVRRRLHFSSESGGVTDTDSPLAKRSSSSVFRGARGTGLAATGVLQGNPTGNVRDFQIDGGALVPPRCVRYPNVKRDFKRPCEMMRREANVSTHGTKSEYSSYDER